LSSFGLEKEKTNRRPEALSNVTNLYFYAWSEEITLLSITIMMMIA